MVLLLLLVVATFTSMAATLMARREPLRSLDNDSLGLHAPGSGVDGGSGVTGPSTTAGEAATLNSGLLSRGKRDRRRKLLPPADADAASPPGANASFTLLPDADPQVAADLRPWVGRGITAYDLEVTKSLLRRAYASSAVKQRMYPAGTPLPAPLVGGLAPWITPSDGVFAVIIHRRTVYFLYDDAKRNGARLTLPGRWKVGSLYLMLSAITRRYRVPDVQFLWNVNPSSHLRPPGLRAHAHFHDAPGEDGAHNAVEEGGGGADTPIDEGEGEGQGEGEGPLVAEVGGGGASIDEGEGDGVIAEGKGGGGAGDAELPYVPAADGGDAAASSAEEEEGGGAATAQLDSSRGKGPASQPEDYGDGGVGGFTVGDGGGEDEDPGVAVAAPAPFLLRQPQRRLLSMRQQHQHQPPIKQQQRQAAAAQPRRLAASSSPSPLPPPPTPSAAPIIPVAAPVGLAPLLSMCKAPGDFDVLAPNSYFKSPRSWNYTAGRLGALADASPWAARARTIWWRGASGYEWPACSARVTVIGTWHGHSFTNFAFTNNFGPMWGGWMKRRVPWAVGPAKVVPKRAGHTPFGDTHKQPVTTSAKHRYSLHLPGSFRGTYSRALQYMLWTGTTVFLYDAPYFEFYYHGLTPWVHYVPVNLTNLRERWEWAEAHPAAAEAIGAAGLAFARSHLSSDDISAYWVGLLRNYARLQAFDAGKVPAGACGCWEAGARPARTPAAVLGHCPLVCSAGPRDEYLAFEPQG